MKKILLGLLLFLTVFALSLGVIRTADAGFKIICTRILEDVGSGFVACGVESDSCMCSYSLSVVPNWLGKANLTLTGNNLTELQNVYSSILMSDPKEPLGTKLQGDFSQFKKLEQQTINQTNITKSKIPITKK
jgi:hypothetical protein